jgi:hypothetical protein
MLWFLPLTAGVGTVWLWYQARHWPQQIAQDGIHLRNGRTLGWRDIRRVSVVKDQLFEDERGVIRLDLETYDGVISLDMDNFDDGQSIAHAIRDGFKESRADASAR